VQPFRTILKHIGSCFKSAGISAVILVEAVV